MKKFLSRLAATVVLAAALVLVTPRVRTEASPTSPAACTGMVFDQVIDRSTGGVVVGGSMGTRYLVFLGMGANVQLPLSGNSCYDVVDGTAVTISAGIFNHGDVCVLNGNTKTHPSGCETIVP